MTEHNKYVALFEFYVYKAMNSAINKQSMCNILLADIEKLKDKRKEIKKYTKKS